MAGNRYIFGGDKPWDEAGFTAVDDRVRGGSSVSHLIVNADRTAATFNGTLDTKTLGGAGFASQRTVDPFLVDLTGVGALIADVVVPADNKTYTLTLKNDILPTGPDGREQSTVSWEYDFVALGDGDKEGETKQVKMPIDQFKPTYRGRPAEDAKLDLANIKRISFMMRSVSVTSSFFEKQDGDFSLTIKSLAVSQSVQSESPARISEAISDDGDSKGQANQALSAEKEVPIWRRWLCNW
ncbi:CIA30 family protein [Pyricularia oryzae Y34]|uniref:CIA30 family protein n=2 Tax=Pyricularia oryzae TaxID=318829 RepID=A0AA97NYL5_PYRO3|nr:CIA30 family protein [Pyricularia oryzae Y34]